MIKPLTLQQAVENDLREAILTGVLGPGSSIAIDELIERFGVSRVPIRDALRVLEGEGLVTSRPRRGYVVSELTVADLREMQEIRGVLEHEAIEDARPHMNEQTFADMKSSFAVMCAAEDSGDYTTWIKVHREFHFAVFELSQNRTLVRLLHQLWNASDIYRAAHLAAPKARAASKAQHEQLLDAVQRQDVDGVLSIMRDHRRTTVESLEGARTVAEAAV